MQQQDDTSLKEIIGTLWGGKWLIVIVTIIFVVGSGAGAWLLPKKYQATVVLSPVSNSGSGNGLGALDAVTSQLSGIASLAGISLKSDTFRAETLATLQSGVLVRRFIDQQHLLPLLLPKNWQPEWHSSDTQGDLGLLALERATERFKSITTLSQNSTTGLVDFSVTWTDPLLAAQWANSVVKMTNDYLRDKAIRRSENNIAYLNQQAAKTDIAGVREAIYTILESEIKSAMLARGTDEYALTVIDPAVPPERHASPRKLVWLIVGTLSGLFVSIFAVLIRRAWA